MKKFCIIIILMISTAISAYATCSSDQIEDETTGHCMNTFLTQDGKGAIYHDTETFDVVVKPLESGTTATLNGGGVSVGGRKVSTVRNVTLAEGITSVTELGIGNYYGSATFLGGTLKLPSTIINIPSGGITNCIFETIDASDVKNATDVNIGVTNLSKIILSESSSQINLIQTDETSPKNIVIQCKGRPNTCLGKVTSDSNMITFTAEPYKEYDKNGNPIVIWDENGRRNYTYDRGGNRLKIIDENGKVIWTRRIYTTEEAIKASKPIGNKFKIRYQ